MINITSPSHKECLMLPTESPTLTASLRSNFNISHTLKRPLSHPIKNKSGNTKNNIHSNNNNSKTIYSQRHATNTDFSFSTLNKENIPSSTSNNSLYKSFGFNGSPSLSRKSSIKKHLRKKSSTNMFKNGQSTIFHSNKHNHKHNHSRSKSQSSILYNQNHNHSQTILQNSNTHTVKHAKSNSSISTNSIFKSSLSSKPSIDSIFNSYDNSSNKAHHHLNNSMNYSNSHNVGVFSANHLSHNNNLLISPSLQSTPNKSESDSYYSSEENISDDDDTNIDVNISNISYDYEECEISHNDMMDFGSPLQKKQSDRLSIAAKIKNFKFQRHQSLGQFGHNDISDLAQLNYKFDTDQLACTINGLSVKSDDDDSNNIHGNSVLHDVPFSYLSFETGKIPRIDVTEFKKILADYEGKLKYDTGKFCKHFDELIVVDCRFKFEYDGGHIRNAINVSSFEELENTFFNDSVLNQTPVDFNNNNRKLLVFHCEFSSHRGPMKADQLRYFDRNIAGDFYPNLFYPDVVVLEGGYKDYYESEKGLHKSLSYVEMDHPLFKDECDRNLHLLRRETSLSRQNSRTSSSVSLSRKTSHSSIKSTASLSLLDFSSVNKIECHQLSKARSSKRLLPTFNSFLSHNQGLTETEHNDDSVPSSYSASAERGLFGGFGNHYIDLDNLVDKGDNYIDNNDTSDSVYNDDIDDKVDRVPIVNGAIDPSVMQSHNRQDRFKIPLPRPKINRISTLHSRSKTVSSFSFSNYAGFKSAPLLSTPEKTEAKFGNLPFYKHDDLSVYSVAEQTSDESADEYTSIYSHRLNHRHLDTPISKLNHQ